ncbi:hypothetical protein ASPCAL07526 [Aspergillus calidoustus]|uniref:Uncharacterized protein n=1 Tax=Aspergillus calidoustus TaxID=454130 RepID=A0A0U5GMW2_ASPCI|nr:hypothetical protein ASPCAL07526 [Aspergillus calidoustus]
MAHKWLVVPACSMICRAYTMPATCDKCATCKSVMYAIYYSASIPSSWLALNNSAAAGCSFLSWALLLNALAPRMNRWLILMAISWYVGMFNAWPNRACVSRFNTSRNWLDVHARCVPASGPHKYGLANPNPNPDAVAAAPAGWLDEWANPTLGARAWASSLPPSNPNPNPLPAGWVTSCCCCCCAACHAVNCSVNGNTNHMYHTINSPTARGTYQWISLMLLLAWNPLWYAVTTVTIPSLINIF